MTAEHRERTASDAERAEAVRALEAEFGVLARRFRQAIQENARRLSPGLMPVVYKIFTTIAESEPVTASGIALELDTDKGLVSRSVRELESLGLISREPDPNDGRSWMLSTTPEGRARLDAVRAARDGRIARTLADWETADIRHLARLLSAFAEGRTPGS